MALGTPPPAAGRSPAPPPPKAQPAVRRLVAVVPRAAALALFLVVLAATLSYSLLPGSASLKEGSVAPQDFAAPRSDVDSYQTAELRRQAAAAVPSILRFDPSHAAAAATALEKVVGEVKAVLADTSLDQEAQLRGVTGRLPGNPSAQVVSQVVALGPDGWEELGK